MPIKNIDEIEKRLSSMKSGNKFIIIADNVDNKDQKITGFNKHNPTTTNLQYMQIKKKFQEVF